MPYRTICKPLFTVVPEYFPLPACSFGQDLGNLCHSSLMRFVQSFELDSNCFVVKTLRHDELRFGQVIHLTHLQMSFWDFDQCVHLLNQLGLQLHSFEVTIRSVRDNEPRISPEIVSVGEIC